MTEPPPARRVTERIGDMDVCVEFTLIKGWWTIATLTASGDVQSSTLREIPLLRLEAKANAEARGLRKPSSLQLNVPSGFRKPDEFYRQAADVFLWLSTASDRPAQDLAEANGVPPSTVHNWVREAKARGLLAYGKSHLAREPRGPGQTGTTVD